MWQVSSYAAKEAKKAYAESDQFKYSSKERRYSQELSIYQEILQEMWIYQVFVWWQELSICQSYVKS